jgi:hypothetical protein
MSSSSIPARLTVAMNGSVGAVRRFGRGAMTPLAVSHFRLILTFDGVLFSGMAIWDSGCPEWTFLSVQRKGSAAIERLLACFCLSFRARGDRRNKANEAWR